MNTSARDPLALRPIHFPSTQKTPIASTILGWFPNTFPPAIKSVRPDVSVSSFKKPGKRWASPFYGGRDGKLVQFRLTSGPNIPPGFRLLRELRPTKKEPANPVPSTDAERRPRHSSECFNILNVNWIRKTPSSNRRTTGYSRMCLHPRLCLWLGLRRHLRVGVYLLSVQTHSHVHTAHGRVGLYTNAHIDYTHA